MTQAPTELLIAPVGAGKTEIAQDRILALKQAQPLARIWVLLPTERQITAFRARLIARVSDRLIARVSDRTRTLFNVEFFNFYSLYSHLLSQAGRPQRCLDGAARMGVLRSILRDLDAEEQLPTFTRIVAASGFAQVIGEFLYELKQNLITPEAFTSAARSPKEIELARIYARYQRLLQQENLVDRDGEGWLALAELPLQPALGGDVALLVADGYDQFSLLQAALLTQLAARAQASLITLTTVTGREATVGRRFDHAQTRLTTLMTEAGVNFQQRAPAATDAERAALDRHPTLSDLTARLFVSGAAQLPPADASAVQFLEAPDIWGEAGMVLRRVKALLLAGNRPDDVLIAVRDWPLYGGALVSQARQYQLPFTAQLGEPLADNPVVVSFMALLGLALGDFRRRDLLAVLRSPYFDLDGLASQTIDAFERAATERLVLGGRAEWLAAVDAEIAALMPAAGDSETASGEEIPRPQHLTLAEWQAARAALVRFFEAVTPPQQETLAGYIRWIERLIPPDSALEAEGALQDDAPENGAPDPYHLNIPLRARDLAHIGGEWGDALSARDMSALSALVGTLRAMLSVGDLLSALKLDAPASAPLSYADFYISLRAAVSSTEGDRRSSGGRDGRILITTVTEARGLPHAHVFIVGLSEGIFPARTPEDALLLDSERDSFDARLEYPDRRLLRRADRADEPGLFYEVIGQARASLTLSRPTLKEAAPWIESPLWRAAWSLFARPAIETLRAGQVLALAACATPGEAALTAAHHLTAGNAGDLQPLYGWLGSTYPALWAHIRRARMHEARRSTRAPHDAYSGRLNHPPLIEAIARQMGSDRLWSASQLNEAGTCAYRFFAGRMLRLSPVKQPEEGADILQRGQVYHAILEQTYSAIQGDDLAITPENEQAALAILDQVCTRVLADAPRAFGFRATLWAYESAVIRRRMRALVERDFQGEMLKDAAALRTVDTVEQSFQFTLPLKRSGRITVRGRFDRIDRADARRVIIDYKSGSTSISPKEIVRGRNFQMLVYLLAARDQYPDAALAIEGQFWHLSTFKPSGALALNDETRETTLQPGLKHIDDSIIAGRAGDFSAEPNGTEQGLCYRYCDFHALCRMSVLHPHKQANVSLNEPDTGSANDRD